MADSYPCPRCGEDVPTHGVYSGQPTTGPELMPADTQHAECPRCKARLYRSRAIEDQGWMLVRGVERPPWDG